MKNNKFMSLLLAAIILAGIFTGCQQGNTSGTEPESEIKGDTSAETPQGELPPIELQWTVPVDFNPDAEVVQKIQERFNVKLLPLLIESGKEQENLNIRIAGGEIPDVIRIGSPGELPNLVEGGVAHELSIEIIREKAPNYAASADANDDGTLWTSLVYDGKNYGVTQPLDAVPMAMVWRKDWLDKLDLEVPKTLEEYEKVLTAFVEQDPDSDGERNTAGIAERAFGSIFGAYGLRIVTGGFPGFTVEELQLGEDNVPFFPYIRPEAKEGLALLADWYQKGIIDKEFITGENHGGYAWLSHSFMNNNIGLTSAQPYHYLGTSTDTQVESNWATCMVEFKGLQPEGDIVFGPPPMGKDGHAGTEAWSKTGEFAVLTTKAFEDERKVDAFLAMTDAYHSDMDYTQLSNFGLEGVHFEATETGPKRIMEGVEARKDGVMLFSFGNTVLYSENLTPEKNQFGHSVSPSGYYRYNAPAVEEYSSVIAALDTMTEQAYFDIITGAQPIEYFDTYVEDFKRAGGETAEKAVQEAHAARSIS